MDASLKCVCLVFTCLCLSNHKIFLTKQDGFCLSQCVCMCLLSSCSITSLQRLFAFPCKNVMWWCCKYIARSVATKKVHIKQSVFPFSKFAFCTYSVYTHMHTHFHCFSDFVSYSLFNWIVKARCYVDFFAFISPQFRFTNFTFTPMMVETKGSRQAASVR